MRKTAFRTRYFGSRGEFANCSALYVKFLSLEYSTIDLFHREDPSFHVSH
jgi:hypothetical protein